MNTFPLPRDEYKGDYTGKYTPSAELGAQQWQFDFLNPEGRQLARFLGAAEYEKFEDFQKSVSNVILGSFLLPGLGVSIFWNRIPVFNRVRRNWLKWTMRIIWPFAFANSMGGITGLILTNPMDSSRRQNFENYVKYLHSGDINDFNEDVELIEI